MTEHFGKGKKSKHMFVLKETLVPLGSLTVKKGQSPSLVTPPLGTAVAVAIVDPVAEVGGLLAAILPDSTQDESRALDQPALFMDSGLHALMNEFTRQGGQLVHARLFAAGGMDVIGAESVYDVGPRNRRMLLNLLPVYGLTLEQAALGGYISMSLALDLDTGEVRINRSGQLPPQVPCKK